MIIGLTGYKRSGKDSVANILVEEFGFVKVGFADALREMALAIDPVVGAYTEHSSHSDYELHLTTYSEIVNSVGYEKAKELPQVRRFLQRLGTEGIRGCFGTDAWVEALDKRTFSQRDSGVNLAVPDVRFPNEAEWVLRRGFLWRINRPGFGGDDAHESERHIPTLPVHQALTATNLTELRAEVLERCQQMLLTPVRR